MSIESVVVTAFVFPGQGSLEPGVLDCWRDHTAAEVVDLVGRRCAVDLWRLPDDAGSRTALAQPAIFAASLAAHRALNDAGVTPDVVAGHSLGEVAAAVAAGCLTIEDGAALVGERGRAFANACACTPGTMAAVVRLDETEVRQVVAEVDGVTVANINGAGQVAVSGTEEAVAELRRRVGERGGRALPLNVEGAFHSTAMAPAMVRVDRAARRLSFAGPRPRLITGISGQVVTDAAAVRSALVEGVLAPVRWLAVQQRLAALGVDHVVEVGPGGVLARLAGREMPEVRVSTVAGPTDVDAVREAAMIDVSEHGPVSEDDPAPAAAGTAR